MKNLKKVLATSLVALFMVFSVASIAGAATYKDGTYDVENGGGMNWKLHVVVSGGKITEATTKLFYGETEMTEEIGKSYASVGTALKLSKDYGAQLVKTNDPAQVKKAADDTDQYDTWMKLVKQFEDKAKSSDAAASTSTSTSKDTSAASSTPKTGVIGLGLVYGLGALATGAYSFKKNNK